MALPVGYTTIKAGLTSLQLWRKLIIWIVALTGLVAIPFVRSPGPLDVEGVYHEVIERLGWALLAVCVLGRVWCSMYIGGRKAQELVSSGPYSVCRNPLYMFSYIGAAGLGAQTGSLSVTVFFALVAWLIFLPVIRREEVALGQIFGAAFNEYKTRVPRFLPRLSVWRDVEVVEVRLRRIYKTLADGLIFPLLIPVFELIDLAQESGYLTVLLRLP